MTYFGLACCKFFISSVLEAIFVMGPTFPFFISVIQVIVLKLLVMLKMVFQLYLTGVYIDV